MRFKRPFPRERVYLEDGLDTGINMVAAPVARTPDATAPVPDEEEQNYVINNLLSTARQDTEDLPPESEIINTLEQWVRDWSNKNVDGYISHYADNFISANGQNLQSWQEYRRPRITSPECIEVSLSDLEVELTGANNAQADFIQTYNVPGYTDETFKRLMLVREPNGWKINRELSIDI